MPAEPKIYHIVHVDRLPSIIADGWLWCDAEIIRRSPPGTTIGMNSIKQRRLNELTLTSYPGLHVGDCVPFYFCPRSIMLDRRADQGLAAVQGREAGGIPDRAPIPVGLSLAYRRAVTAGLRASHRSRANCCA